MIIYAGWANDVDQGKSTVSVNFLFLFLIPPGLAIDVVDIITCFVFFLCCVFTLVVRKD